MRIIITEVDVFTKATKLKLNTQGVTYKDWQTKKNKIIKESNSSPSKLTSLSNYKLITYKRKKNN